MEKLVTAGLILIPVTGRPAGWCDHIARMWPVDAVVGENGAFWFRYDPAEHVMHRRYVADGESRKAQRARLQSIAAQILDEVPQARVAADQLYRESDLAIDYGEDGDRLPDAQVDRIVQIMRSHGLTAKVSSIHVNGWFGTHDKLTTTLELLGDCFRIDPVQARDGFAFVGDSPNDQPMFEFFPCSVGVANVRAFEARLTAPPAYVTEGGGGAGFAEFADRLIAARNS
jgi:HAD superfamily hydrolase (TIGR01484 family)